MMESGFFLCCLGCLQFLAANVLKLAIGADGCLQMEAVWFFGGQVPLEESRNAVQEAAIFSQQLIPYHPDKNSRTSGSYAKSERNERNGQKKSGKKTDDEVR